MRKRAKGWKQKRLLYLSFYRGAGSWFEGENEHVFELRNLWEDWIVGKSVVIYLCWLGQNFAATSLRLKIFFFVSVMAGHLLRASQLRRGAYRSTNFCIKISSYLSRVTDRPFRQKDRPNSNFCDQKRTPVYESVQYIWSLFWQRRGMRYFNLSILFDAR